MLLFYYVDFDCGTITNWKIVNRGENVEQERKVGCAFVETAEIIEVKVD